MFITVQKWPQYCPQVLRYNTGSAIWPKNSRLDQINIAYSDLKCDQLVAQKLHPSIHFCVQLEETDTG